MRAISLIWLFTLVCGLALAGCVHNSLKLGASLKCPLPDLCIAKATPFQVDRHCRKNATVYDNGTRVYDGDGKKIIECVGPVGGRYILWYSGDYDKAVSHGLCHYAEFKSGRNEHDRCDKWDQDKGGRYPRAD